MAGKSHCDAVKSIKTKLSDAVFARWRRRARKEESREKCKLYIVHFVVVRSSHCDAAESIKTKLSDTVFARWRHGLLNHWIGN